MSSNNNEQNLEEYGKKFQIICLIDKNETEAIKLINEFPELVWYRDPETEDSPLHWAAKLGSKKVVRTLLDNRHPWNVLNKAGNSAGEVCQNEGHEDIYKEILDEGVRAELILGILDEVQGEENAIPNDEYLKLPLKFSSDKILDYEDNGVMMGWEGPLMEEHAKVIAPKKGLNVLNIGFGLGLIDSELQKLEPKNHTIVEAHPDVYKQMISLGWDQKPGVRIIFGRWQDKKDEICNQLYDGIFFDTFGEYYKDLKQFHEIIPNVLAEDGVYSFFNGLGGDVKLFHDVYCQIAQLHLLDMGIETEYVEIDMDPDSNKIWDGVKRRYWQLKKYYLPICKFQN
ncbi:ankyrin repeat family protein [Neoconidiobolus thromboides FSU 785]|nr:ankyrin repeat family protein [Neoconidiobolus thromboides FSU 785]